MILKWLERFRKPKPKTTRHYGIFAAYGIKEEFRQVRVPPNHLLIDVMMAENEFAIARVANPDCSISEHYIKSESNTMRGPWVLFTELRREFAGYTLDFSGGSVRCRTNSRGKAQWI